MTTPHSEAIEAAEQIKAELKRQIDEIVRGEANIAFSPADIISAAIDAARERWKKEAIDGPVIQAAFQAEIERRVASVGEPPREYSAEAERCEPEREAYNDGQVAGWSAALAAVRAAGKETVP